MSQFLTDKSECELKVRANCYWPCAHGACTRSRRRSYAQPGKGEGTRSESSFGVSPIAYGFRWPDVRFGVRTTLRAGATESAPALFQVVTGAW